MRVIPFHPPEGSSRPVIRVIGRLHRTVNIYFRCNRLFFRSPISANDPGVKKPRNPANPYAHILPFPVGPIMLAPSMITAEGGVYRAALALSFAYWLSGCRPLPTDKSALASLIRLPQSRIGPMNARLQSVLSELLPILAAEYDAAYKNKAHKSALCKLASDFAVAKRRSGKSDGKSFSAPPGPARIAPVKAPPYAGSGRTDMQARQAAIEREAAGDASQPHSVDAYRASRSGLLREGAPVRK